ncbi:MAG: hypothetical protein K2J02_01025 [Malacoplasma sp.]|nr:hypothetical protein [Malacoplasma sp.]
MKKKWKKIFLWTCLTTTSIGVCTIPIISTSSQKNTHLIDNSQKISNLESKLFLNNKTISKNDQVDFFRNISLSDVLKEVKNADSEIYSNMSITRNSNITNNNATNPFGGKDVFEEINNNIEKFSEITENILSGKTPIEEINKNLEDYKNKNSSEYENILEKISDSMDVNVDVLENNDFNLVKSYNSNTTESKLTDITIYDDSTNEKITITADNLAFAKKSRMLLDRLKVYRDKVYGVSIASAVLTAASWAIAVFYWAAWWMFGANVPFAVAASVQAGIATYYTKESFDEWKIVEKDIKNFESELSSKEFSEFEEFSNYLLVIADKKLQKGAIDFSIVLGKLTTYPRLLSSAIQKIIKKGSAYLVKTISLWIQKISKFLTTNFSSKLIKTTINFFSKRIKERLLKLASSKTAMKAVSWASPASAVISALDIVLSICSFGADIAILNPRELNSW